MKWSRCNGSQFSCSFRRYLFLPVHLDCCSSKNHYVLDHFAYYHSEPWSFKNSFVVVVGVASLDTCVCLLLCASFRFSLSFSRILLGSKSVQSSLFSLLLMLTMFDCLCFCVACLAYKGTLFNPLDPGDFTLNDIRNCNQMELCIWIQQTSNWQVCDFMPISGFCLSFFILYFFLVSLTQT